MKLSLEKKRVEGGGLLQKLQINPKMFFKSREYQNDSNHSKINFPGFFYLKEGLQEVFI